MRAAIFASLCLSLLACGDDLDGLTGDPDAMVQPAACEDPEPGIICTIAGSRGVGYSGDDGPAIQAELSLPQDVLAHPDGDLFVLDWNNHRVRRITSSGTIVHVSGRGELGGDLDDPENQDFNHPTNILFDQDGSLLIAAWHNSKIRSIDPDTGEVTDRCGDGRRAYFGDEGPAATASFDLPAAIAFNPDGELIVMDQANQVIRRIDAEGVVHRLAGNCIIDAAPPIGPGPCEAPVACPGGSGKLTCGDPLTTCSLPCAAAYAAGDAATLRMAQPFGQSADPAGRMVFDGDGNLIWADTENSLIRKLDPDGVGSIVAGLPPVDGLQQKGYSGDGGPAAEATLNRPVDLAIADDGTLYFTDVSNHCVRAIDPDGVISTVAGVCSERGDDGDGELATEAHLKIPFGVELDGDVLYIADTGNSVIRAVKLR
jgi:hypothetical protein